MRSDGDDGRAETRLCVQRAVASNFRRSSGVGFMAWRLRIEAVRNFMSSRISADAWEMFKVEKMSMNRIPVCKSGFSRDVG